MVLQDRFGKHWDRLHIVVQREKKDAMLMCAVTRGWKI